MDSWDCVYVNDRRTARVENGKLRLLAVPSGEKARPRMLSRGLATHETMAFKYGYLEMCARVPFRRGAWPSFWLTSTPVYRKSRLEAEVDVFEVFSSPDTIVYNLHKWTPEGERAMLPHGEGHSSRSFTFPAPGALNEEFHVYGFEWTPKEMSFWVDGKRYARCPIGEKDDFSPRRIPGMDCFHDFLSISINNELFTPGRVWSPEEFRLAANETGPIEYCIEWIRLWQRAGEELRLPSPTETARWKILLDCSGIVWDVAADRDPRHDDCIEMSGLRASLNCSFSVTRERALSIGRTVFWPSFRVQPNNTYGTLSGYFGSRESPALHVDGKRAEEKAARISFDGILRIDSEIGGALRVVRNLFPSAEGPAAYEYLCVTNAGCHRVCVSAVNGSSRMVLGCDGRYEISAKAYPEGEIVLNPGDVSTWTFVYGARRVDGSEPVATKGAAAYAARRRRVEEIARACVLRTGERVFDTMFRLAKIHAGENIFETRRGLMHSPGGGLYYAGTWCNDQCEYAAPWLALTGDEKSLEASFNAYRQYLSFMGDDYSPIPCSLVAEGCDYWNGARDRGDAAMWASGAARFVLASGRRDWARELLRGLRWTLEYCRRRVNAQGVVLSDTDELEGRLPAGSANLCTSCLYYDALRHAAFVMRDLGHAGEAGVLARRAEKMRVAIERHFGQTVKGFASYRYYEGCDELRAWMGMPLAVGIRNRLEGTCEALFSPFLWTGSGILSGESEETGVIWDRSLLTAVRGLLAGGKTRETMPRFLSYSRERLLGAHVPFPVEASDGAGRQLSGESALYCRVFTEGLLGLDPVGFGVFDVKPHLPSGWKKVELQGIRTYGKTLSVAVTAQGVKIAEKP